MNYKHLYHAGNFCDVFKHIVLISLIESLKKKEKPFCYLETHAGAGLYDLTSIESEKTKEYQNGILKLKNLTVNQNPIPELIETYLNTVQNLGFPNFYPGSPLIAKSCLRTQDQMILMEYHPLEAESLKRLFAKDKQVNVHHQEGYQGLKAFLPPKERRGLILIDPPYEKPSEWDDIIDSLEMAYNRFPTGIYAIWYPIKDKNSLSKFQYELKVLRMDLNKKNTVDSLEMKCIEINIYPEDTRSGLMGSGMIILNPPWQWDLNIKPTLPWLWQALSVNNQGSYRIMDLEFD